MAYYSQTVIRQVVSQWGVYSECAVFVCENMPHTNPQNQGRNKRNTWCVQTFVSAIVFYFERIIEWKLWSWVISAKLPEYMNFPQRRRFLNW